MSTSRVHWSGTLLSASPPRMRPRLIDGRSNSSEDSRLNGSDSIALNVSTALRTALSPSHGVDPCDARLELPGTGRHHVEVRVQHDRRPVGGTGLGSQDRQPKMLAVADLEVLGL